MLRQRRNRFRRGSAQNLKNTTLCTPERTALADLSPVTRPCAAHWRATLEVVEREQESRASDQTVAGLDNRTELAFDRRGLLAMVSTIGYDYGVIITA